MVTSEERQRPSRHGIRVRPSGLYVYYSFPSDLMVVQILHDRDPGVLKAFSEYSRLYSALFNSRPQTSSAPLTVYHLLKVDCTFICTGGYPPGKLGKVREFEIGLGKVGKLWSACGVNQSINQLKTYAICRPK